MLIYRSVKIKRVRFFKVCTFFYISTTGFIKTTTWGTSRLDEKFFRQMLTTGVQPQVTLESIKKKIKYNYNDLLIYNDL